MRNRVLVVESESVPRERMVRILTEERYSVSHLTSTEKAMDLMSREPADLIIMGYQPVGFTTMRFASFIRGEARFRHIPLMLVSDAVSSHDAVALLRAGIDIHLSQTMTHGEIAAHVKALLRRVYAEEDPSSVFERGGLLLRAEERRVVVDGKTVKLTRKEFELLRTLMSRPQKVFSFESLLNSVWGYDRDVATKTLQVHVTRLRTKLRTKASVIKNSFGVGYAFQPDEDGVRVRQNRGGRGE